MLKNGNDAKLVVFYNLEDGGYKLQVVADARCATNCCFLQFCTFKDDSGTKHGIEFLFGKNKRIDYNPL